MYKRAYIFLVLFIACIQFMQAQKSYSIKGIVKEAASGEPVPYATVVIWNTTQGTATDSVGNFRDHRSRPRQLSSSGFLPGI